jgi:flagellar biosynthesis anti-sigma factor FlgM
MKNKNDEVKKYADIAKKIPEVRQDKIDAIKKQIEEGTFNVPAEYIADSIIAHHKELTSTETPLNKVKKRQDPS